MKLLKAKEKIHEMRSALDVIANSVAHLKLSGKEDNKFRTMTLRSIGKLKKSTEELSDLVHSEIETVKKSNPQAFK